MNRLISNIVHILVIAAFLFYSPAKAIKLSKVNNISQITIKDIDGDSVNLADYNAKFC